MFQEISELRFGRWLAGSVASLREMVDRQISSSP